MRQSRREIVTWVGSNIVPHEGDLRARLRRLSVPEDEISDIVQDAYLKIAKLTSVDHIRNGRGYFFTTARTMLLDRIRRERIVRIDSMSEMEALRLADEDPGPERHASGRIELERVRRLIEALPGRCREIFELRRVQGVPQREIAQRLGVAEHIAEGELYAGDPAYYQKKQKLVYGATPEQVLAASRKWLSDGVYVLEARALPQYAASGKPVDRSAKPAIGPAANFNLPPLQHATLSNGIKVALAERRDVPAINLSMMFDVGSLPDRNPASVGLASAMGLATAGTTTRSKLEISAAMQDLGASISWATSNEISRLGLSALNVKLDESLDLYADILLNPTFPDDEWERMRDLFVAGYADNMRTPEGKLAPVVPKLIYGAHHPYAAQMTPAIAEKLTSDDFRAFYKTWIRPDLASILIVGDTTLAEIMPKLERRLAGWKVPAAAAPVKPPLPAPVHSTKPRVVLIDQPGAESSLLSVGHTGPARSDRDYDVLSVVDKVMGGHFVSRLNMNLREDKGWSYGMRSQLGESSQLSLIGAAGAVQADKTADALGEMDRELREIGTKRPPSAAEILAAKNAMLLGLPASLQGPKGVMSMYRDLYEYRLPDDYWDGYIRKIQSLSNEDIQRAAKRLYRPSELTWFVVGDLAKIEADIRKLNLGEVIVMNADAEIIR